MAGSVAYVWHQKGQTTTQKLVQARMIAQAAALLLLCSAAYFSATHGVEGETKVRRPSHLLNELFFWLLLSLKRRKLTLSVRVDLAGLVRRSKKPTRPGRRPSPSNKTKTRTSESTPRRRTWRLETHSAWKRVVERGRFLPSRPEGQQFAFL
jgi:hypothetical protein